MQGFWVEFTDGTSGYCEGNSDYDAKRIAEHFTGKKVEGGEFKDFTVESLPYPAKPVIWQFEHPLHGKCPAFCYTPDKCKGRTSCPNVPACTE